MRVHHIFPSKNLAPRLFPLLLFLALAPRKSVAQDDLSSAAAKEPGPRAETESVSASSTEPSSAVTPEPVPSGTAEAATEEVSQASSPGPVLHGAVDGPMEPNPAPVGSGAGRSSSPAPKDAAEAARDGEALAWVADHFFSKIKVRGYTQFRINLPTTNAALVNLQGDKSMGGDAGFFIRRARLIFYGDIHPLLYVYLQPEFASSIDSSLNVVQLRDWYVDIAAPKKEFRLRIGQSKVPFGFENMQSSQNRLTFDRSDAVNSAVANERDIGAFFYWAPAHIRERFSYLVKSGLKGSGDYGVVALGVYNGQTANRPELNTDKHVVGRVSYPFLLGEQYLEVGGGAYAGKYVPTLNPGIMGQDEYLDARGNIAFTLYPQPFGLQFEYNLGVGPELVDLEADDSTGTPVYTGSVEEQFLHGGYLLASYKWDSETIGTLIPYCRGVYYEGGKKHETNAPRYSVREIETGVEWQPIPALELTGSLLAARRTSGYLPYQIEEGYVGRFQLQINY